MIQKKICMLGTNAVGKTSLVARFVRSIYSEVYYATVGVKVDKKVVSVNGSELNLILWDLAGEDEFAKHRAAYLTGAAGYLLVVDGTRLASLEGAHRAQEQAASVLGPVPFVCVLNKSDLRDEWELDDHDVGSLVSSGWHILYTSARTGEGVEQAFLSLGAKLLPDATPAIGG
jgi:small GTP-binding protein